jgi:hypothetical protein
LHGQVAVIDAQRRAVVSQWPISQAKLNVALALDEARHRLFVGCRSGHIVVFDTSAGKQQAVLPLAEGVDDLFFDAASKCVFAPTGSGGGTVEAYRQRDPDHYEPVAQAVSGAEGKNGVYCPQVGKYFVGVPDHAPEPATILAFEVVIPGADRFAAVKAPYAQALVRKIAAAHPEVLFLGLHVTPPGKPDNVIIACTDASKLGKVSTDLDMEVVRSKGTKTHFNKMRHDYEVDQWFTDAGGNTLGMIVYRFAGTHAKSEAGALKYATEIGGELQKSIPNRERLFRD